MRLRESLFTRAAEKASQSLPAHVFETRQARRALADIGGAGLTFIHVPRTAGLSVTRAIYGLDTVRHFTIEQFLRIAPEDIRSLPRFTIVRNPWDRAVSAYQFARGGGVPGGSLIAHPQRYRGPAFSSFETFVTEYLVTHDRQRMDGVFRPQTYYVRDGRGAIPFDHVGMFDRLPDTAAWLSAALGRAISITTSNGTRHGHYRDYYTPATRRIVGEVYRDDVETFGFEF